LSEAADPREKILTWDRVREWRAGRMGKGGGRVVFTNGVFDLLHTGHLDVLLAARRAGEFLVVGVNSDSPVRDQAARCYVLAALAMVDVVVVFDQDTPLELIRALRPDVLVKGGDYTEATIVGADELREWGGQVLVVPLTPGHSTTSTIERLRGT
jgi:D-beta-D-heptose 7-phosphate kinase/D-beta-D-heptose 1-phosphate adenosyltransferase